MAVIPYGSRHVRLVLKGPDHLCKSWSARVRSGCPPTQSSRVSLGPDDSQLWFWSSSGSQKMIHFQRISLVQMDNKCSEPDQRTSSPPLPIATMCPRSFSLFCLVPAGASLEPVGSSGGPDLPAPPL